MNSKDLLQAQAGRFRAQVAKQLGYLGRVRRRMELMGFLPEDSLYLSVARAHDAMQELHVRAHYAACTSGVCK